MNRDHAELPAKPLPILPMAPPLPAPYLAAAPQLPDELLAILQTPGELTPAEEHALQAELARLRADLRGRRTVYEQLHGIEIVPERPVAE